VCRSGVGPKLRFPEFQNAKEWRIKKLNSLLYEAKHRNRSLELGPTDVLSVSGEHGCVNQIEFMGRSYAGVTVKDYHVVEHGDIVYTKSPLKRNPYGIIKENKGKRGIVSTLYAVYRPFADSSATYLDHFFSVDYNLNAYLQPIVRKGPKNDMKVNNADVLKGNICVPPLPEQEKIADCLDSVDALIAAQGRKVAALRAHKKCLMQQLFPQEGETQPRLRFLEFRDAGEWDVKTVGDVSNVLMCKRIFAEETNPHIGVPFFKIGTLGGVPDAFIAREKFEEYKSRYKFPRQDEILITCSGTVGKCLPYDGKEAYFQDSNIVWLDNPKGEVTNEFLFILLSGVNWGRLNSTTITRLYGPDLRGLKIKFPGVGAEQQRIADCVASLDDFIAAETRKLDTLKTHKKGLMQQLFPSVGKDEA
jgi:type I restriction enzyme S subunit